MVANVAKQASSFLFTFLPCPPRRRDEAAYKIHCFVSSSPCETALGVRRHSLQPLQSPAQRPRREDRKHETGVGRRNAAYATSPRSRVSPSDPFSPFGQRRLARGRTLPAARAGAGLSACPGPDVQAHVLVGAYEHGIPGKVVAELMGHAKVDTTLNVYTQVIDGAKLAAAQAVGNGLIEIERNPEGAAALIH